MRFLLLPKKNSCLSEVVVISVFWIKFQLSFASEGLDDVVLDHQKKDVCLQTYFSSLTCNPHWGKKSILSFHYCVCQVPSLALCLVLLLLVSLFIRCDRFYLILFHSLGSFLDFFFCSFSLWKRGSSCPFLCIWLCSFFPSFSHCQYLSCPATFLLLFAFLAGDKAMCSHVPEEWA